VQFLAKSLARLHYSTQIIACINGAEFYNGGLLLLLKTIGSYSRQEQMTMKRPGMSQPDPAVFIRANLPISPVPSIPEIRIHTAGPASGLWRLAGRGEADPPPY
jgi:hypothetical protein